MTVKYSTVIVKEGRKFWAYVPGLPGVYGLGNTANGAKKDLADALGLLIEDCRADGAAVPRSAARIVGIGQVAVQAA